MYDEDDVVRTPKILYVIGTIGILYLLTLLTLHVMPSVTITTAQYVPSAPRVGVIHVVTTQAQKQALINKTLQQVYVQTLRGGTIRS